MITNKDISIDSENGKIVLNGDKYDLGTQGEIDTAVKDVYSVMGQMGAKNLIPYPYDYSSRPSLSGITYTINADNSITMNGTTTARVNYWLYDHGQGFMGLKSGDYILSKTGRTDVAFIVTFYKGSTWVKQVTATVNDMKVSIDVNSTEYDNIGIAISFGKAGITVVNATVYPMLRLASDTDNTYQPYAMTNKQLTAALGTKQNTLTFDSAPTAESANPVTSEGIKTAIDNKAKTFTNIENIDEDFVIQFTGVSDIADRVICPINFPFAFASNDYTLTCSQIELVGVGVFTKGISYGAKFRSGAMIIFSTTSAAGTPYIGTATIHITRANS